MKITHIRSGDDGQSHFDEVDVALRDLPGVLESAPLDVANLRFSERPPGYFSDFHNAPRRQFVVILTGRIELTTGAGGTYHGGPGDVFFANDLAGQGHTFREVEGPLSILALPVTDAFDFDRWCSS